MPDLPLTGACMCGAVRFEITEPLPAAGYCHCTRCQRRSGTAAAVSARVAPGSFRVVEGEELVGSWDPPGGGFRKSFCRTCGSALWAGPTDGEVVVVRMGSFDEDPGVRPSFRQHTATAVAWEPLPEDGLERFERARGA